MPFGQDRLVPIFLATLAAIQQKTPAIRFKTAAEMLDIFGMSKGGREYRRLIAAFERIFGATIFFGTDTLDWAFEWGLFDAAARPSADKPVIPIHGKVLRILHRESNGDWKFSRVAVDAYWDQPTTAPPKK